MQSTSAQHGRNLGLIWVWGQLRPLAQVGPKSARVLGLGGYHTPRKTVPQQQCGASRLQLPVDLRTMEIDGGW